MLSGEKEWKQGTVKYRSGKNSYIIETGGRSIRRNRRYLRLSRTDEDTNNEGLIESEDDDPNDLTLPCTMTEGEVTDDQQRIYPLVENESEQGLQFYSKRDRQLPPYLRENYELKF